MKRFNLIIFLVFLFGFFQLFLVYKNFQLMNKIGYLEDKKDLLIVKIKKEDIHLDSLFTLSFFFANESLKINSINLLSAEKTTDSSKRLFTTEIAKKENGEK